MNPLRIYALFLLCLFGCISCQSAASVRREADFPAFASADRDLLRFSFDWRMGQPDSLRAGSALFFRFELPSEKTGEIKDFHVVDKFASQFGIDYKLVFVEGREKTIGILSFSPEETAELPAGLYDIAVEIQFADDAILLSKLLPFRLLPRDTPLDEARASEERRRFAALLQLNNDKSSYDAVAPLVVEPAYQSNILARLLRFYDANVQRPSAGAEERQVVQNLTEWTRDTSLSVSERELSILALEEVYARYNGSVRNGR